jgi:hypothetical protein
MIISVAANAGWRPFIAIPGFQRCDFRAVSSASRSPACRAPLPHRPGPGAGGDLPVSRIVANNFSLNASVIPPGSRPDFSGDLINEKLSEMWDFSPPLRGKT